MARTFAMSMFASKADLYEAKCLYLEQELAKFRDVAIEADIVYDTNAYMFEDREINPLARLKAALDKVEL